MALPNQQPSLDELLRQQATPVAAAPTTTPAAPAIPAAPVGAPATPGDLDRQQLEALYGILNQGQYAGSALAQTTFQAQQAAQEQFSRGLGATQATALDAIRRANAQAIASGASAGLGAANQLSAILGLQQESVGSAADLANQYITSAQAGQESLMTQLATAVQSGAAMTQAEATLQQAQAQMEQAKAQVADITLKGRELDIREYEQLSMNVQSQISSLQEQLKRTDLTSGSRQQIQDYIADLQKILNTSGPEEMAKAMEAHEVRAVDITKQKSCITKDTLITMGDGTQQKIKDIKPGEEVLTYTPQGNIVTKLYTPLEHSAAKKVVLRLWFNDNFVDTVDGHSFILFKNKKAVAITIKNVKKYIGKEFVVGYGMYATLNSYEKYEINEVVYSPMAWKTMFLYTNGVLSTAHLTEFIVNGRLSNPKLKSKDLIKYEEVPSFIKKDVPEELFDAYDGEMLKVWAKGFKKFTIGRRIKKLIGLLDPL